MRAANSEAEATNQTEPRCTSTTVASSTDAAPTAHLRELVNGSSVRARRGSESGEQRSLADRPTRPLAWEEAGSADDWDDLEAAGRRTATSLREVSSLGQRSAGRTAGKYSNPPAQRGTSRHVQEQGHAFDLRKYGVTGVCLVVHTEEVTGSIPVSPTAAG